MAVRNQTYGEDRRNRKSDGSEDRPVENVDRTLQLVPGRGLDGTQCFRCENESGDDRGAKGLRHSESLNAFIERNSKLFSQENYHHEIDK
jgi:hypothetical protein